MEALKHLEALGYRVEFHSNEELDQFWVIDPCAVHLPETIHQYVDSHKEEIRQALRQRQSSEVQG